MENNTIDLNKLQREYYEALERQFFELLDKPSRSKNYQKEYNEKVKENMELKKQIAELKKRK